MDENRKAGQGISHEARAALMAFMANTMNGIVVFGVYHMSGEQLATVDAWLSSAVVFLGYLGATRRERLLARPPTDDSNNGSQT